MSGYSNGYMQVRTTQIVELLHSCNIYCILNYDTIRGKIFLLAVYRAGLHEKVFKFVMAYDSVKI